MEMEGRQVQFEEVARAALSGNAKLYYGVMAREMGKYALIFAASSGVYLDNKLKEMVS